MLNSLTSSGQFRRKLLVLAALLATSSGCGSGGDESRVVPESAARKRDVDVPTKAPKKP